VKYRKKYSSYSCFDSASEASRWLASKASRERSPVVLYKSFFQHILDSPIYLWSGNVRINGFSGLPSKKIDKTIFKQIISDSIKYFHFNKFNL